ncbi:MAG: histidine kinase, partial [Crocinitomicaceae bacterium]|nr:histidine kinase [Crocinitomicaceae bacterium]
ATLKLYIFTFYVFAISLLRSQDPNHFVIGAEELSGIHIYTLLYDDQVDVLYAGTNSGLYAYKQNQFIKLRRPDNCIGNSFNFLQKNSIGEVYCSNFNGQVFKVDKTDLKVFCSFPKKETEFEFSFFFDKNDNIIATGKSIIKFDTKSKRFEYLYNSPNSKNREKDLQVLNFSKIDKENVFFSANSRILRYKDEVISVENDLSGGMRCFFGINDHIITSDHKGEFMNLSGDLHFSIEPKRHERSHDLGDNRILGMGRISGARIMELKGDTLISGRTFFSDEIISSFARTEDDCFFFGTFGNGIKVVPSLNIVRQRLGRQLTGISSSPSNEVYISSFEGELFRYKAKVDQIFKENGSVNKVRHIPTWFPGIVREELIYTGVGTSSLKDVHVMSPSEYLYCNQSSIIFCTNKIALNEESIRTKRTNVVTNGEKELRMSSLLPVRTRVTSVTMNPKDSVIYYSTYFGIFKRPWNSIESTEIPLGFESTLCNFVEFYDGKLICAIENQGIWFLQNDKHIKTIGEKEGLRSNTVKQIFAKDGLLYILTIKGLQVYSLEQDRFLSCGAAQRAMNNCKIVDFSLSNDHLWLLEKKGFLSVELSELTEENKISALYLDSITVNYKKIDFRTTSRFSYDQNAFNVYFDYRDIVSKSATCVKYKLDGFSDDWKSISTLRNEIEYQSLPAGKYTFRLKATSSSRETEEFNYSFEICLPYWQTWWFFMSIMLCVVSIIVVYYRFRLKRQKHKMELINEVNSSKLKAIQSQMNPHFIFNSINSIQDLVLHQEAVKSYDYMVDFSKLIRKTLEFSENEFISIDEEVVFLRTYLGLEQLRFGRDFNYEILYEETIEKIEVRLPSLIIQPFIENALKHGLIHKEGEKRLFISLVVTDHVKCEIIDNGVGRTESEINQKRQNREHVSFSTNAINERMKILKEQFGENIGFEIIDLYGDNGESIGTKVILTLPILKVDKKSVSLI